jgi:hypothetical protein
MRVYFTHGRARSVQEGAARSTADLPRSRGGMPLFLFNPQTPGSSLTPERIPSTEPG